MTCTFFGHRDCDKEIYERLKNTIVKLIKNEGVTRFLVGNNGSFDRLVLRALRICKENFPHIDYFVVLAYMPKNDVFECPTLFPEELDNVPKRYAISYRNKYMIDKSDFVVAYISRNFGGAYKSFAKAKKMNKRVINLYEGF